MEKRLRWIAIFALALLLLIPAEIMRYSFDVQKLQVSGFSVFPMPAMFYFAVVGVVQNVCPTLLHAPSLNTQGMAGVLSILCVALFLLYWVAVAFSLAFLIRGKKREKNLVLSLVVSVSYLLISLPVVLGFFGNGLWERKAELIYVISYLALLIVLLVLFGVHLGLWLKSRKASIREKGKWSKRERIVFIIGISVAVMIAVIGLSALTSFFVNVVFDLKAAKPL
ncbi:MAG: hypothetical protein J6D37_04780 [Clostridia bacterium]|nr:hypothetical protein [Clostridia bacterium]